MVNVIALFSLAPLIILLLSEFKEVGPPLLWSVPCRKPAGPLRRRLAEERDDLIMAADDEGW